MLGLAGIRRPPTPVPATWRTTFAVSPAQLVAVAASLAPAPLRDGARRAAWWAAKTARGPLRVTTLWSSTQHELPRRVRVSLSERSGAGDETDFIAWAFSPRSTAVVC